jgi:hypothetical protein
MIEYDDPGVAWLNWIRREIFFDETSLPIDQFIKFYNDYGYLTIKQFRWLWGCLPKEYRLAGKINVSHKNYVEGEDESLDEFARLLANSNLKVRK